MSNSIGLQPLGCSNELRAGSGVDRNYLAGKNRQTELLPIPWQNIREIQLILLVSPSDDSDRTPTDTEGKGW